MMDMMQAILDAEESVWVAANRLTLDQSGLVEDFMSLADARLDLRVIVSQAEYRPEDDLFPELDVFPIDEPLPDPARAGSSDWVVRWTAQRLDRVQVIVDSRFVFEFVHGFLDRDLRQKAERGPTSEAVQRFDALWTQGLPVGLIYEAPDIEFDAEDEEGNPVETWEGGRDIQRLIASLARAPGDLFSVDPRKFEELIAELLRRDGFEVQLTPFSKDGGVDVFASRRGLVKELYLVQCKRNARKNKVGVDVVQRLYGCVEGEKATAGLIVTTSSLTADAARFCKKVRHRMDSKDYVSVVEWLNRNLRGRGSIPPGA